MIDHAILLAAGQGSRLLPMTETVPKCLVKVGGRTILSQQLDALAAAGIARVTVVTGYRHPQVAEALAQGSPVRAQARFNPFWAVANSIGSVWAVRDELSRPFCLLNGDTLFDSAIIAAALREAGATMALAVEPLAGAQYDDMLVRCEAGFVRAVAKTLPEADATHRSLGIVIAGAEPEAYANALDQVIAERGGAGAFHHAIVDRLARNAEVRAIERAAGFWQEIDRPEDIATWREEHRPGREDG